MVDVQGIKCFLPGSLAAANKINDFDAFIGKTFFVMIDGYVAAKDIFVVSYKKYLSRIMEQKIQELDLTKKYKGYVTGTSNFGVFVEWEDIYTGLLHKTEFENQTVGGFNTGDEIEFYIKEVKDDNRLTLTFGEPVHKTVKIYEFKKAIDEGTPESVTVSVKHKRKNGALVEMVGENMMAFIPQEKLGKYSKTLKAGDTLDVIVYEVDPVQGKIFVEPINE
jgi:ribosomal protein S1